MTNTQFQLSNPPQDGITHITFSPDDSKNLLVSSWDKTLRLYNTNTRQLSLKIQNESPLLDCCFGTSTTAFSGSLDNKVHMYDLTTQTKTVLCEHQKGVRCVQWSSEKNSVFSASWDSTLKVMDPRSFSAAHTIDLPNKAFSMDLLNNTLAIAMGDKRIHIYDIRNLSEPTQTRDTTLKYMLKCIRLMPQAEGFACSSIEGRVALEFFDPASQDKKYAFKLHRQTINDTEVVYPVNALAFHPKYGTFASGGSDCIVNIWDGVHRKRVKQFTGYPDEISSIAFSRDGSTMAVASSYIFDEGERDHAPDAVFVRELQDSEVRPRKVQ